MARLAASEFDKNSNISVRESNSFPGSTLHGHDFYELDIILSGSTDTVLNGKPFIAERGVIFFLTPADFHKYAYEDGFDLYNIQFTSDAVSSDLLTRITQNSIRVHKVDEDRFDKICRMFSVMKDLYKKDSSDAEIIPRLLECILLLLFRDSQPENREKRVDDENIQKAIMYIHSHFKENPTLSEVADALHLNSRYFCTRFKSYTAQTYKEYLRAVKLRYARRLVLATSIPIIEVAENSGYSTQSHFNREFKDYYGISPLQMRLTSNK